MLLVTGTTLNVQSFMGAIMAIGIAVANSILLVTFAERARKAGQPLLESTEEGATSRLRAILMTAAAMIFGMVPMAIGFGEGGSQSAPLGRAVIGGLIVSTFATLTVLPSIYAVLQARASIPFCVLQRWMGADRRSRGRDLEARLAECRVAGRVSAVPERLFAREGGGLCRARAGGPRQRGQSGATSGRIERARNGGPHC
jgi:hypothetical protein